VTTLRAEFTLATGLDAVKVAEPLAPAVKLNPFAEPRAIVPSETDSESESESAPAAESLKEGALPLPPEKASDPFPLNEGEPGTLVAVAFKAATVIDTPVEADRPSVGSETDAVKESAPE
jgi:hypothetical protein